ncbi:hypothetical protein N7456_007487 [Penicillium angulare]|uniref:Uncharacterized protein n=1 Tax=Penicillium angulare TaxID=116970 RepID=A0A9W9K8T7_9EURO|nr:hypothetical protein N7456_007487 [Penicillium angulare]
MRPFCEHLNLALVFLLIPRKTGYEVRDFSALELCEAVTNGWTDTVDSILASGVDPNARFDDLDSVFSGVAENWASEEQCMRPPMFEIDETEAPVLRRAAVGDSEVKLGHPDKNKATHLMATLLQHGADPYGLYPQPIYNRRFFSLFPGQPKDKDEPDGVEDKDTVFYRRWKARMGVIEKSLRLEYKRRHIEKGLPDPEQYDYEGKWEEMLEDWIDYLDLPFRYGVRSVIHSLLEGGMVVQPIFDFLGDKLEVERRDPQGRTLFLAACRSRVGLDAATDGVYADLRRRGDDKRGIHENPYPQPNNPWKEVEGETFTTCTGPTMLSFLISHGADLLAVDNYGKNALHLLFTYTDHPWAFLPPLIDNAVEYLIKNCPSLINQPDKAGFYPLHLAIWRMNSIVKPDDERPASIYRFEETVDPLIAAGADIFAKDGLGNTVLHYLAGSRLSEVDRLGKEQRRLLQTFLKRGIDPKARNADGQTALEIFCITDDEGRESAFAKFEDLYYGIGEDVFGQFEQAGYSLQEPTPAGQTLMHLVAGLESGPAWDWFKVLEAKGLDPMAKDKEGETSMDIGMKNIYNFKYYWDDWKKKQELWASTFSE